MDGSARRARYLADNARFVYNDVRGYLLVLASPAQVRLGARAAATPFQICETSQFNGQAFLVPRLAVKLLLYRVEQVRSKRADWQSIHATGGSS